MTPTAPPISPVVRWLAVALAVCTFCPLLVLGGLTSSTRSGMADPVWPTEPWFVIVNGQKLQEAGRGYLLEHTHRLAGWVVGGLAVAVAVAAWVSGPDKRKRLLPLVAVGAVLLFYGWFHGQMMAEGRRLGEAKRAGEAFAVAWPWASVLSTLLATAAVLLAAGRQAFQKSDPARWVRVLATLVLLGVMVQGLLGGLRVFLDTQTGLRETVGVELSQLHGLFAQVVFAGMCALPVLAARPVELAEADRRRVLWPAVLVPAAVLVQLVWAVWVRHATSPGLLAVAQRLHMITAFVVAGLVVWQVARVALTPGARRPVGFGPHLLSALLLVQVLLGVEAWMGKFAATGPEAGTPPTDRREIYEKTGWVLLRTAHQLIGAGLLAAAAAVAVRVWRAGASREPERPENADPPVAPALGSPQTLIS